MTKSKKILTAIVAGIASATMTVSAAALTNYRVGSAIISTNTNLTTSGVIASVTVNSGSLSSAPVRAYCYVRVPSGGPSLTISGSGSYYAYADASSYIASGCTVTGGYAHYDITSSDGFNVNFNETAA